MGGFRLKLPPRLTALFHVTAAAWPVWLFVIGTLIAIGLGAALASSTADSVRYAGTILQGLGLATVAVGLGEMRRLFGRRSLIQSALRWLRDLRAIVSHPTILNLHGVASGDMAVLRGDLSLRIGAPPNATIDQRVAALEADLANYRKEVEGRIAGINRKIDAVVQSVHDEASQRRAAIDATQSKIESVAVGGLHLESMGLGWLLMGVVFTSIPSEIASLVVRLR
jgi:hypothetical protein